LRYCHLRDKDNVPPQMIKGREKVIIQFGETWPMEIQILVGREEIGRCLEWGDRVEPINPGLFEWVSRNWFVDLTIPSVGTLNWLEGNEFQRVW
jgi:hypothetical protein